MTSSQTSLASLMALANASPFNLTTAPQPDQQRASIPDLVRNDDDDAEFFEEGDLAAYFRDSIASSIAQRVEIPELALYPSHTQQFFLLREIFKRLVDSMAVGKIPSCDVSYIVKIGPVLAKLGKLYSIYTVADAPNLSSYSFEELVQNLGITTLRRKPRMEVWSLLTNAFESGRIFNKDEGNRVIEFEFGGTEYKVMFHNRLCVELVKGRSSDFKLDSDAVERFIILSGSLRPSIENFRQLNFTINVASQHLTATSVKVRIDYNPKFKEFVQRSLRRVGGESLWWWAMDMCSVDALIPAPYTLVMGKNPPVNVTYVGLATEFVRMALVGTISIEAAQEVLRAIRKGTILDMHAGKNTGDILIAEKGSATLFYETVIAKLGPAYSFIEQQGKHVNMFGVTDSENLMVKAVLSVAKTCTLYDVMPRIPVQFGDAQYPVNQMNIVPELGKKVVLPDKIVDTIVVLDTNPGQDAVAINKHNMGFAEMCLDAGASGVIVKLFKSAIPVHTTRGSMFLARGRCHNGEFFSYVVPGTGSMRNILMDYPDDQYRTNFTFSSIKRGCDDLIFGAVGQDYPLVRRVIKQHAVKDNDKLYTQVATAEVNFQKVDVPEELMKLASATNVVSSSANTFYVESMKPVEKTSLSTLASKSNAFNLIATDPVKFSDDFKLSKFPYAVGRAPSVPPKNRFAYVHHPEESFRFVGVELNGMPVYELNDHVNEDKSLLLVTSGYHPELHISRGSNLSFYRFFPVDKIIRPVATNEMQAIKKKCNALFVKYIEAGEAAKPVAIKYSMESGKVFAQTV